MDRIKSINCSEVPLDLLDKNNAKAYFRQFGRVIRLCLRPKSRTCSIEYDTQADAERALCEAGEFNGQSFTVKWDTEKSSSKKIGRKKKLDDPDWNLDPEVQAELNAMLPGYSSQYNLRPEKMDTESPKIPTKPAIKKSWKSDKLKKPLNAPNKKQNVTNTGSIKLEQKEHQELMNVLKQPAFTHEEKYKILEARDKLVRLYTTKNTDMQKVEATVGTCPDMCPEKERIMREIQHQVHFFEQEVNGRAMNHTLAIKQYSRSSADQEVPLPYELRPVSTLQLTMGYLMHEIMDLCETADVNIAEWYHFVWDRTRGIRKDITQQELCSAGSVELLEQCARFHIHCSARLAAEEPSVFDQKINTENLTKCLQTLKYMYHDLKLKGIFCDNEPEFRAYIILLNLNDGNFMWEVQQLEDEVVKSQQVKFALDVYSALDKNNYIKFFKLVKSTTYLNACTLLRYFIQIRLKALRTLLKSYTPRSPFTNFPVDEFSRILAFEDVASAIDFLEYYNLYLNPERTHVVLDRKAFSMPELPYAVDRAINVVESKRNYSIGEVVCGKALPPPLHKNYVPHSSFDPNGILKQNEYLFDLNKDKQFTDTSKLEEVEDVTDAPLENEELEWNKATKTEDNFSNRKEKVVKTQGNIAKPFSINKSSIFTQPVINPEATKSVQSQFQFKPATLEKKKHGGFVFDLPVVPLKSKNEDTLKKDSMLQKFASTNVFPSQTTTPSLPWSNTFPTPLNESQKTLFPQLPNTSTIINPETAIIKPQEDAKIKEFKKLLEEKKKQEEMEKKRQQEEQLKKKLEEKAKAKKLELERKQKIKQQMEDDLKRKIAEEKRMLEINSTVNNVLEDLIAKVEENIKMKKLNEISQKIRNFKIILLFKKWQNKTKLNKRKRKAVDQCPTWIYRKSPNEEAKELYTQSQDDTLQNMKRYKRGVPNDIPIYKESLPSKIDLHQLTFKILQQNVLKDNSQIRTRSFWKISLSIPDQFELPHSRNRITDCLDNLFDWKTKNDTKIFMDECRNPYNRIVYCIENNKGIVCFKETNGLLFISTSVNDNFIKRVKEGVKNFNKVDAIPLFFVIENVTDIERLLFVKSLENVCNYKIVTTQFTAHNLKSSIENGLTFLSSNINEYVPLELDMLKSFLLKYLAAEPWKRIASFAKWNRAYKSCLMKPKIVVKLYNEALEQIKNILLEKDSSNYGNFPEIFKECLDSKIPDNLPCDYKYFPNFWNSFSYKTLIEKLLNTLKLPNYTAKWPKDGKELEQIVYDYCTKIFKDPQTQFYKVMAVILVNIEYDTNFYQKVREILWTNVIETIATEKIIETDFLLKNTPFSKDCIFNECFVTYNVYNLQEYKTKPWFYVENPIIQEEIDVYLYKEPQIRQPKHTFPEFNNEDFETTLKQIDESKKSKIEIAAPKTDMKAFETLLKDLEESMAISQQISNKLNSTLKTILEDK